MMPDSPQLNESIVWQYHKPTSEWTEGQIQLKALSVEERHVNWKVNMLAAKPGNMQAFIAVDDFSFRHTEGCHTLPSPDGGSTTTTSPKCPGNEVACGDGTCIPETKKCNFMNDCPNDTAIFNG